jgi:hypothetical protein
MNRAEPGLADRNAFAGAVRVAYPDVPIDPFFNVNTVADLQEAERMIRRSATTPSFKNYS